MHGEEALIRESLKYRHRRYLLNMIVYANNCQQKLRYEYLKHDVKEDTAIIIQPSFWILTSIINMLYTSPISFSNNSDTTN